MKTIISNKKLKNKQNAALYQLSVQELLQLPVSTRKQALIEWRSACYPVGQEPYQFTKQQSEEEKRSVIERYEIYLDGLKDHPGFEVPEIKVLITERRQRLADAVSALSPQTLGNILTEPDFKRFSPASNASVSELNAFEGKRVGMQRTYPAAVLYSLFHEPHPFLTTPSAIEEVKSKSISLTKQQQRFVAWLEDCVGQWLTFEQICVRNSTPQKIQDRVFMTDYLTANTVKQLILKLRRHPDYHRRIETRPGGLAWRLIP